MYKIGAITPISNTISHTTSDGLYDRDELEGIVYDIVSGKNFDVVLNKYKTRAIYDSNLLLKPYLVNKVIEDNDVIVLYDKSGELLDESASIELFESAITGIIYKILDNNLVQR